MTAPALGAAPAWVPLRVFVHVLIAIAVGVVAPFTGLAWPFALLVGVVLGSDQGRQLRGERSTGMALGTLGVAGGILGMLFFGAIVGGLVAIAVVMLTTFSERAAAYASPTDRGVARILLFLVPIAMWVVVFPLLGLNVNIRIGG